MGAGGEQVSRMEEHPSTVAGDGNGNDGRNDSLSKRVWSPVSDVEPNSKNGARLR